MLNLFLLQWPFLREIDEIDGKDASLDPIETLILSYFHSFHSKNLPIHPSYRQIAKGIGYKAKKKPEDCSRLSEREIEQKREKAEQKTIQRAVKSLQNKGYICVVEKGNSWQKANRYEFCPGRTLWELFQLVDKENPGLLSKEEKDLAKKLLPLEEHTEPIKSEPVTSKAEGLSVSKRVTPQGSRAEGVPKKTGEGQGKKQKVDAHGWKVLTPEEIKENKRRVWNRKYRDLSEHWKDEWDHLVYIPDIIKDLRGEEAEKCLKGEEVINQDKWFNPPDDVLDFINGLADQGFTVAIGRYWDGIANRCCNLGETKFNLCVVKEENLGNGIYIAHYARGQK